MTFDLSGDFCARRSESETGTRRAGLWLGRSVRRSRSNLAWRARTVGPFQTVDSSIRSLIEICAARGMDSSVTFIPCASGQAGLSSRETDFPITINLLSFHFAALRKLTQPCKLCWASTKPPGVRRYLAGSETMPAAAWSLPAIVERQRGADRRPKSTTRM